MDRRVTPPKRIISPTCNPRHTQLGHPLLYPYFWQKVELCSFSPAPVLIFLLLTWKLAKTMDRGVGGGGQKIPLLSQLMWRGDEYCSPRHIKLGHPVLYPYSDKKVCSLLPLSFWVFVIVEGSGSSKKRIHFFITPTYRLTLESFNELYRKSHSLDRSSQPSSWD